ncbi:AAA family ATPase [Arthrobacter sp. A2-55]|uniref:nucleotide-binding protein n=1 Tax=Arthrobacter sp. A2-55 TaxID=2897337 RepID=UPI0021CDC8A2|nr:AAA family ATPase [Arthrobacter sp. A2-55]MCU6481286.1 AAA family ATPase [Arthrobacter sp. A2-55]
MNTAKTTPSKSPRVGLIELPELAALLAEAGVTVLTGADFRTAAAAIRDEMSTVGAFPIIAADVASPGLRAWLDRIAQTASKQGAPVITAVMRNPEKPIITSPTVRELLEPLTVNALLAAVGMEALDGAMGDATYPRRTVAPAGLVLPEIDDDLFDDNFDEAPAFPPLTLGMVDEFDDFQAPSAAPQSWEPVSEPEPVTELVAERAHVQPVPPTAEADPWDTLEERPLSRRAARELEHRAEDAQTAPSAMDVEDDWDVGPASPAAGSVQALTADELGIEDWEVPTSLPAPASPAARMPAAEDFLSPEPEKHRTAEVASAWTAPAPVRPIQDGLRDASAVFDNFEASRLSGSGRSAAGLAALAIVHAGKGGVGKSTTSIQLARFAAAAGLRVILIDGNSGQGDLRTIMRLNRTNLPTIFDAGIGSLRSAVLTPDVINQNREDNLGHVNFAFVAAPPDDINDTSVVTNDLYLDMISYCRRNADLVVLDTQIIENVDRTGVVGRIIVPALVHDAWGIGVTDLSNTGLNNLNDRLQKFALEGVPVDRMMTMINMVEPSQMDFAVQTSDYFAGLGTFLGAVERDPEIKSDMNAGRFNLSNPDIETVLRKALLRITGNEAFRADEPQRGRGQKPGFFSRVFGKKAA